MGAKLVALAELRRRAGSMGAARPRAHCVLSAYRERLGLEVRPCTGPIYLIF